jgi:hypothetical protein
MVKEDIILQSERSVARAVLILPFTIPALLIAMSTLQNVDGIGLFFLVFAPAISIIAMLTGPWAPAIHFYSDRVILIRKFRNAETIRFENILGYFPIIGSIEDTEFVKGVEVFYADKSVRIKNQSVKNATAINNFLAEKGVKRMEKGTGWDEFSNWLLVVAGLIVVWMILYALILS